MRKPNSPNLTARRARFAVLAVLCLALMLVFAGLLLPAGAFGDRYGRKGVLLAGLFVFGGASAVAIFVNSPNTLIGLRAVIGVLAPRRQEIERVRSEQHRRAPHRGRRVSPA